MIQRRSFVGGAFVVLAVPSAVRAQQAGKPVTIGWLSATNPDRGPEENRPYVERELRQAGWMPHFELRYGRGDFDRLGMMARELVAARPPVIVAPQTSGALAASIHARDSRGCSEASTEPA